FFLVQKVTDCALSPMRFDHQATRIQARRSGAQFNLCPVPRKHNLAVDLDDSGLECDIGLRYDNGLTVMAARETDAQRRAEDDHLQPREGQNGPEPEKGQNACDPEAGRTG